MTLQIVRMKPRSRRQFRLFPALTHPPGETSAQRKEEWVSR